MPRSVHPGNASLRLVRGCRPRSHPLLEPLKILAMADTARRDLPMRMLPTSLRDRLRAGLLTRFALAGLVAVVLLGVVLARTLSGEIRQRSLADAGSRRS